jgi:hypothetical protein
LDADGGVNHRVAVGEQSLSHGASFFSTSGLQRNVLTNISGGQESARFALPPAAGNPILLEKTISSKEGK